ncbi:DUF4261 domain-containing protein [Clostridium merdae]|uniref:DUF4261 domain-containing protein n=1 Tax=Clostridium merdae TaxID=1958780 RepID=UPI000A267E65|nr:DUF4261 domain-containing protein [Clostridium merdae]
MEKKGDSFVEKWHSVYFFMPVFEQPIKLPYFKEFEQGLTKKFGEINFLAEQPQMPQESSDLLGVALWDHPSYYQKEDRSLPSQLLLYGPDKFDQDLWDEQIIAQFWDCQPDWQGFAARCRYSLMASNMMAANLPRMEQYQIMADYADLLLELFPECIGIYWPHSQRLVPREAFEHSGWNSPDLHFLDGGFNVRFFNLADTDGEMLFDTLGFTAIDLPDLQCHCKDLEPGDVVLFLRNLAAYLYRQGNVIQDGNTVEGIDGGKWHCQREDSMVRPKRMVLDICPGKYAGGGRA